MTDNKERDNSPAWPFMLFFMTIVGVIFVYTKIKEHEAREVFNHYYHRQEYFK